jgi:2-haloacid dehalogenase
MKNIKACVFNAYGTLLDTYLPFEEYKDQLGENALVIYKLWRAKRLQYSSQLSLMNRHTNYEKIRKYALDFACDVYGVTDETIKKNILKSHSELDTFPDAKDALEKLREKKIETAVLSNGAPRSLVSALKYAKLDHLLHRVISTEQVHAYKPAPIVYEFLEQQLGFPANKIAFVSSNSWDIAGAASYGFYSVWINRNNRTPERLPYVADCEIKSLGELDNVLGA